MVVFIVVVLKLMVHLTIAVCESHKARSHNLGCNLLNLFVYGFYWAIMSVSYTLAFKYDNSHREFTKVTLPL